MYYTIILYLSLQLSFPSLLTSTNKESTDFLYQIKTLSQLVKTQKQLVKTSRQVNASQLVKATSKLNNTTAQQAMTSSEVDESEGNTESVVPQNISQNRRKAISSSVTALAIIVVALLPKFLLIYNAKKKSKSSHTANHIQNEKDHLHDYEHVKGHKHAQDHEHLQNHKHIHDYNYIHNFDHENNHVVDRVVEHHITEPDMFFEELRKMVIKNDPIFIKRFKEAYPIFTTNILKKHPGLIKSEFTLCAMILLNFSAKEIAEYTFIQHRSVQTNRSRLRKKMNLSSEVNLDQYIRLFS